MKIMSDIGVVVVKKFKWTEGFDPKYVSHGYSLAWLRCQNRTHQVRVDILSFQ
jgi:hypothetical protein